MARGYRRGEYYYGGIPQYAQGDREHHIQTFFFLDRAITDGQTIYFKGLVVDTDGTRRRSVRSSHYHCAL